MTIGEILAKLNKSEQKNYMLAYLLVLNDEDRKDFIENIVDNDLILLAKDNANGQNSLKRYEKKVSKAVLLIVLCILITYLY